MLDEIVHNQKHTTGNDFRLRLCLQNFSSSREVELVEYSLYYEDEACRDCIIESLMKIADLGSFVRFQQRTWFHSG